MFLKCGFCESEPFTSEGTAEIQAFGVSSEYFIFVNLVEKDNFTDQKDVLYSFTLGWITKVFMDFGKILQLT